MHDRTLGPGSGESRELRPGKDRIIREALEALRRLDLEDRAGKGGSPDFRYPERQERFTGGPLEEPDHSGPIASCGPRLRGSRGAPNQLGKPQGDMGS